MRPRTVLRRGAALAAGSVLLAVTLVPMASAQDDGSADPDPDLGTGWVVRASPDLSDSPWPDDAEWPGALAGTPRLGFVVIDDEDGLYSRDGITWQPFSLVETSGELHVVDVAAGPRGFVAVGGAPLGSTPFVWHSRDGRAWDRIDPDDLPAPATPLIENGSLSQVVAGPGGFVITGVTSCEHFAWYSPDGKNWSESPLPGGCGELLISPAGEGWIAVARIDADIVVLDSADGRTWTTVEGQTSQDTQSSLMSLASVGDVLVLNGGALSADSRGPTPAVWVSPDGGATWNETTFGDQIDRDAELALFPITVNDLGFVGSYYLETRAGLVPGSLIFSPDGSSWRTFPADDVHFELAASRDSIIATTPGGIVTWTPVGSELARTGTDTITVALAASLLVAIGVAVRSTRHLLSAP